MIYTPPQVAERWGVKPESVIALIRRGSLPAFTVSPPTSRRPRWKITEAAVADFENGRQEPQAATTKRPRRKQGDVIAFYE